MVFTDIKIKEKRQKEKVQRKKLERSPPSPKAVLKVHHLPLTLTSFGQGRGCLISPLTTPSSTLRSGYPSFERGSIISGRG